ncbi:MAG: acetate kinase [Firmicutes bacterium]|nr:acetate kinase [Bacillota bacterium]
MKVLVLNSGSSSLKYQLFNMDDESVLAKGLVEKIGLDGSLLTHQPAGMDKVKIEAAIPNHNVAIELVIAALLDEKHGVIKDMKEIDAVGHRTVHGGTTFSESCLINDDVIAEMERLVTLAPLHNPPCILGIKACQEKIPGVPMVGVFDTAFHQTMPPASYLYGLPYEYYEKYQLRRYGFHGTSHRFVSIRCREILGNPEHSKIITCHLGNGSSLAAIKDGKVQDTSMGLTPLEGLLMGTRCGDLDPAILPFLMEKEGLDIAGMNTVMNKKSGLLGISGVSSDMRDVEEAAAAGNERAAIALEVFKKTVLRYIGAYAAEMDGVDAIVFTAGIGENGKAVRKAICENLTYLGIEFDEEANDCRGKEIEISKPGSKVRVFIIPTNEELMIARDTKEIISK